MIQQIVSEITDNVRVIVEANYKKEQSNILTGDHIFAYRVTIENYSDYTIQLLRRHWYIFDSTGVIREVEGVGVIGEQPVIEPRAFHQYTSYCNLQSEIGKMWGNFTMLRHADASRFKIKIPEFKMIVPYRMN